MSDSLPKPNSASPDARSGVANPWGYLRKRLDARFQRQQDEIRGYLEIAVPAAVVAEQLYREWRENVEVAEPIQDYQKAANLSATYWWRITDRLRAFRQLAPPETARKYHALFLDALQNASQGAEIAKNGFRFNKFSEVSRGMGYLDRYLELMAEAEKEGSRILRKYRLVDTE